MWLMLLKFKSINTTMKCAQHLRPSAATEVYIGHRAKESRVREKALASVVIIQCLSVFHSFRKFNLILQQLCVESEKEGYRDPSAQFNNY